MTFRGIIWHIHLNNMIIKMKPLDTNVTSHIPRINFLLIAMFNIQNYSIGSKGIELFI